MNTKEAKIFFTNLYKEIWQDGLAEKIPHYYHTDLRMCIGAKVLSYAQIKELVLKQQSFGKQMHYRINNLIAEGDYVAIHIDAFDYLQKNLKVMAFFRFKDEKIYRVIALSSLIPPENN